MSHKRIHIRVTIIGEATLKHGNVVHIEARAIDISAGGLRITDF